jgi:UDP-GlcNAc:undecaprenyl-phosphate/decaprenyl-phosphate GlcNAc-1-phosphate transferase
LAAVLRRLDIPMLDSALVWTPFAVAFTIFAVGGVANAINIVDGYNGLVAGYSILVLAAIAWVAAQVGDMFILTAALSMAGALLGFLAWNYPKGRIFLGDGGAYFLGFWLAELSVLLVARHPSVTPWFPLSLLLYPVFETLFSIYRRIRYRGRSPGHADALHFHQLVYLRLVRYGLATRDPRMLTRRNSSVAVYIWAGTGCVIALSTFFWRDTTTLIALSVGFCFAYLWLYRRVVRLRAPRWLVRTLHAPRNSSDMPSHLERVIK